VCAVSVSAQSKLQKPTVFLGLTYNPLHGESAEGKTNFKIALRPIGTIRAVMLFAKFPDSTREETTKGLYERLAPEGIAFMERASYGKVKKG